MTVRLAPRRTGLPVPEGEPLAEAATGRDGEFRLADLPPSPLVVWARADGFAPAWATLVGPGAQVRLELGRGGGLRVRVIGADHQAVEGARVVYRRRGYAEEALTGRDGWAELADLPVGPARIRASDALGRFAEAVAQVAEGEPGTTECMLGSGWEVAGRVLDAATGDPVPGAKLAALDPRSQAEVSERTRTDPDGHFVLSHLSDLLREPVLRVEADGFARRQHVVSLAPGEALADGVEIRLNRARWLTGKVVDDSGAPISGAHVWWATEPAETVVAGGRGAFRISVPDTPDPDARLVLVARETIRGFGTQVVPLGDGMPKAVTVWLSGLGKIRGAVLDEGGEARSGASVSLEPARVPGDPAGMPPGEEPWARLQALVSLPAGMLHGTTNEDGAFFIESVPAGTYRLRVSWAGSETLWPEPATVRAGAVTEVEIVVRQTQSISGWVVGPQGESISDASIAAWSRSDEPTAGSLSTTSRPDGRFELRGASGTGCWEIVARVPGRTPGRYECAHAGDRGIEVVLGPAGAIEGRVVNRRGAPYAGPLRVLLTPQLASAPPDGTDQAVAGVRSATGWRDVEARGGTFLIRPVAPRRYVLRAEVPGGDERVRPVAVEVPASGEPLRVGLLLTRSGSVEGRVAWAADAAPVVGARVVVDLRLPDGSRADGMRSAVTDGSGRYRLAPLPPGTYRLRVRAAAARAHESQVAVPEDGDPPAATQDVSLQRLK